MGTINNRQWLAVATLVAGCVQSTHRQTTMDATTQSSARANSQTSAPSDAEPQIHASADAAQRSSTSADAAPAAAAPPTDASLTPPPSASDTDDAGNTQDAGIKDSGPPPDAPLFATCDGVAPTPATGGWNGMPCGQLVRWSVPTLGHAGYQARAGGGAVAVQGTDGFATLAVLSHDPDTSSSIAYGGDVVFVTGEQGQCTQSLGPYSSQPTPASYGVLKAASGGMTSASLGYCAYKFPCGLPVVSNGRKVLDVDPVYDPDQYEPSQFSASEMFESAISVTSHGQIVAATHISNERKPNGDGGLAAGRPSLHFWLVDQRGAVTRVVLPATGDLVDVETTDADRVLVLLSETTPQVRSRIDRYDLAFRLIDSWYAPQGVRLNALDANAAGYLALGGSSGQASQGWADEVSLSDWQSRLAAPISGLPGSVYALHFTDDDQLIVLGSATSDALWLMRYDASGHGLWSAPQTYRDKTTSPAALINQHASVRLQSNGHILASAGEAAFAYCDPSTTR